MCECERDSCEILNATTTETSTDECRCQESYYNGLQQQIRYHQQQTNVNVNLQQQQQLHRQLLQQQQLQQMHYQQREELQPQINSIDSVYSLKAAAAMSPVVSNTSMEYSPADSHSSSCSSTSSSVSTGAAPSIGVNLRVTGQCSQGGRKYMEDYFSVAYQQSENAKDLEYAFIGIYDGHGGAEAATFAKEHLMMEIINQKQFWSDSDQDVLRAIREGYIATHYAMWRDQEKWPKTANGLPSTAGTTATVAFIRREKLYIGHVGDSGIVLGYKNENESTWRAKQLTTDHKPESLAERARIARSGGKVVVKSGVPRVVWNRPRNAGHKGPIRRNTPIDEIPFLAVARSLGDLWSYNSACNEFVVSPDPDVKVIKINPKTFKCLIFGTDGLWNVITPQEAVDTVYQKETINERLQEERGESQAEGSQWTNPSKSLVERALHTWSSRKMRADNTSVVTVILYPPNEDGIEIMPCLEQDNMPNSYGLEYTQLNSEFPTYDDATTYQEMVEKYLPPKEYRNFNYYEDDDSDAKTSSESEDAKGEGDPLAINYNKTANMYCSNQSKKTEKLYADANDTWDWEDKPCNAYDVHMGSHPAFKDADDIGDSDDEEEEDEEDADELEEDDDDDEKDVVPGETEDHVTHYDQFNQDASSSHKTIESSAEEGQGYMNSFAESYNSLLNEQISQESSTSNSNVSYQSMSSSSMHEIIQEQQRYQQQCMSEEEGYCLTKLETRREQQRCSAVQTFKIFQQQGQGQETSIEAGGCEQPPTATSTAAVAGEAPTYEWDPRFPVISGVLSRYFACQQQQLQQQTTQQQQQQPQQKPLELNSLLQQEREEEQQVALERLEMERQMVNDNATVSSQYATPYNQATGELVEEDTIMTEYLDDDALPKSEEGVQINEISSSSADNSEQAQVSPLDYDISLDTLANASLALAQLQSCRSAPALMEKLEKADLLAQHPERRIAKTDERFELKKGTPLPALFGEEVAHKPSRIPTAVKRGRYSNIPNENKQESITRSSHALHQPYHTRESDVNPKGTTSSTMQDRRQLRSASNNIDYSKRMLRTRNTLTKDLKAKSSALSTLKRNGTSNFLRTTGANLPSREQREQRQRATASCHGNINAKAVQVRESNENNNNGGKRSKRPGLQQPTTSTTLSVPNLSHAINLRSRQIGYQQSPAKGNPVVRSLSRRRCRQPRGTKNEDTPPSTNFSKSTRLQNNSHAFGTSTPLPKFIKATLKTGTRARAFVAANNAADAFACSKRTRRNSHINCDSRCNSPSSGRASPTTKMTRSRMAAKKLKR